MNNKIIILILGLLIGSAAFSQELDVIVQKELHYKYQLEEKFEDFQTEIINLPNEVKSLSFETWIVNHVNQPIGFCVLNEKADTLFKYFDKSVQLGSTRNTIKKGFKKYWHHFVVNLGNEKTSVYQNGELILEKGSSPKLISEQLVILGMLKNEPFMQLNDLIKSYSVYRSTLSKDQVKVRYGMFAKALETGNLPGTEIKLNVLPFVSTPTAETANINWETNKKSTALIKYGEAYPLKNKLEITLANRHHNIQLTNLASNTNYFAEVEIFNGDKSISTEKLSFKTAPAGIETFRFGVIGDTESRPFINAQIANHVWGNRPDFFVLLGDITDGGKKPFKEQWTMEFFAGTNSLMQRVPIVPLAGNGDGDLYWFNQYFNPPLKEGFYKYSWANADFFILHSYKKAELTPGGKQYTWLENELKKSGADWKFVLLHYAPYSSDEDDYGNGWEGPTDNGDPKVRKLIPLFEQYMVDMVFYGHLHCYERSWPVYKSKVDMNGITYIVSGGGGGNLENFAPHKTFFSAKTYRGHHYVIVNIFDNVFRLDTYDLEGKLIDTFEKNK